MIQPLHRIALSVRLSFAAAALALCAAPALAHDEPSTPLDPAVAQEMVAAAQALVASTQGPGGVAAGILGMTPREALMHDLDSEARADWSYWPRPREGLPLGQMTARQRALTHDLLETLLSARGYLQVSAIMGLEQILNAIETVGFPRGEEFYTLVIFGEPALDAPWGWRFEGHHVSLNVTMTPDALSVTPSFLGANPMSVEIGLRAGLEPLRYERAAAFRLIRALDEVQLQRAIISDTAPRDILSGQLGAQDWDAWRETIDQSGLPAADMTDAQRALLAALVDEVLNVYRPEIAGAERAAIDYGQLAFAWMGPTEEGTPYYFRVVGSDFVYEFDAAQDNGKHVHTVWRDKSDDLGATALERHYRDGHAH